VATVDTDDTLVCGTRRPGAVTVGLGDADGVVVGVDDRCVIVVVTVDTEETLFWESSSPGAWALGRIDAGGATEREADKRCLVYPD
jgi:hypothetical protein